MRSCSLLLLAGLLAGCSSGRSDQPSPASTPAMDSAMTAIHDSASVPDTTVSDTSQLR